MPIEIKTHRIYRDGKAVNFQQTKNIGGPIVPKVIVLHDTAGHLHGRDSIVWLRGGPGQSQNSSAHVVIGRDGTITQLAAFNVKTWHAGISNWRGRANLNGWAVGIEIVNPGGPLRTLGNGRYQGIDLIDTKADPSLKVRPGVFPPLTPDGKAVPRTAGYWLEHSQQQIDAVVELCRALVAAYPTITEIVTHWMIAPTRKVDTNPLFPIDEVRRRVWPARLVSPVAKFADLDDEAVDAIARSAPGEIEQHEFPPRPGSELEPDWTASASESAELEDDGNASEHPADLPAPTEPHPLPKPLVEFVQQRLRALGYYEVGNIDGDFAGRTEDALVTFKRHNGLPPTTDVDDATLRALADASPREIGDARARATPKDVSKIVPAVRQAGRSKLLAWLLGAPSAAVAVLQGVAANVSSVMSELSPIMGWLQAVPGWVWALLIVGIAAGIWWSARKAEADTVDAYRAGRLT